MSLGQNKDAAPLTPQGLPLGYNFKPDWEVTPRDVQQMRTRGEAFTLLDCRKPEEHQAARIDGAVLIPMDQIERRADELESETPTGDPDRTRPIIVHCHHGMRSLRVTATLRALGFTNVKSMAGGIDLWSRDIDPGVPRY